MQAILLVTVFSCLLAAANAVGTVALGSQCTAATDCADANAKCSTNCVCKDGYTEYNGVCAANGGLGTACLSTTPACTGENLVCDSTVCKKKAGQTCSATTECVSLSACSTKCTCNDGYNTASTGFCTAISPGKVNAACDATTNKCTGTNVDCTGGFCKCKTGFSGNKGDDDCSGVSPQSVSSWLLTGSIITCLVTLSLP